MKRILIVLIKVFSNNFLYLQILDEDVPLTIFEPHENLSKYDGEKNKNSDILLQ